MTPPRDKVPSSDASSPSRERRYSTGPEQATAITKTIAERIAELKAAQAADAQKVSAQSVEIRAELEWLKSLGIVSKRLADLREKYAKPPVHPHNDPDKVYAAFSSLISRLVPTQKQWKDATYIWYGKRGEALTRIDNAVAAVHGHLAKPSASDSRERTIELLNLTMELHGAVNAWAAKKLNTNRTEFEDKALELDDRRLQNKTAKEYYTNLRYLVAVSHSFTALLDEASRSEPVMMARRAEMVALFDAMEFDGPSMQLGNAASLVSSAKDVVKQAGAVKKLIKEGGKELSTHIALEFQEQALKEAAHALDVLGVVDGLTAMWNVYKVYERSKAKQNAENQACTRLDDPMVLNMIDTLQSQIQFQCEKAGEAAILYAAAAATKAASHGVLAPVATALKAMKKLNDVVEQVAITAYERADLLSISRMDRAADPAAFAARVVQNVTLTCYYIRLAAPENLLRPLSYNVYKLDDGKSFLTLHNTTQMTEALADVLLLKECADEILMAWNTQVKNLHERAARTTPLDDIVARYSEIDPGLKKTITNALSGKSRNIKETVRQAKESVLKSFRDQPTLKEWSTRIDKVVVELTR